MTERSKGQRCQYGTCITLLGIYSGDSYCRLHTPPDERELWKDARSGRLDSATLQAARAVLDLKEV